MQRWAKTKVYFHCQSPSEGSPSCPCLILAYLMSDRQVKVSLSQLAKLGLVPWRVCFTAASSLGWHLVAFKSTGTQNFLRAQNGMCALAAFLPSPPYCQSVGKAGEQWRLHLRFILMSTSTVGKLNTDKKRNTTPLYFTSHHAANINHHSVTLKAR